MSRKRVGGFISAVLGIAHGLNQEEVAIDNFHTALLRTIYGELTNAGFTREEIDECIEKREFPSTANIQAKLDSTPSDDLTIEPRSVDSYARLSVFKQMGQKSA